METAHVKYKTDAEAEKLKLSKSQLEQVKILEKLKKENDENDKLMFHLRSENDRLKESN